MYCLRRNRSIQGTECPEIIIATTEPSGIALCRTCPIGKALMATVRPQQAPEQAAEQPESTTNEVIIMQDQAQTAAAPAETGKRYTITDISVLSGVAYGCMGAALKGIRAGKTDGNAGKVLAALASLGIGADDLVRGNPGAKQGTKHAGARTPSAGANHLPAKVKAHAPVPATVPATQAHLEPGGLYGLLRDIQAQLPAGVALTIQAR